MSVEVWSLRYHVLGLPWLVELDHVQSEVDRVELLRFPLEQLLTLTRNIPLGREGRREDGRERGIPEWEGGEDGKGEGGAIQEDRR